MSTITKNVCVIGAGSSGLVAAKELLDEGHRVICLERNQKHGGVFSSSITEDASGAYDSTRLTISNYMMAFSSFPPPDNQERRFWSAQEYRKYLTDFIQNFHLDEVIEYGTEVLGVTKSKNGKYDVEIASTTDRGDTTVRQFDSVVVSTGTHRVPRHIDLPGQDEFMGDIIHSAYYRNATPFKGKRVICVGMGETGSDVVSEIAQVAEDCTLSVRRYKPIIERYPRGKKHTNDAYTSYMMYSLPIGVRNAVLKSAFQKRKNNPKSELDRELADWNLRNDNYHNHFLTKNEAFLSRVVDGTLSVNSSGIDRLGKDYVLFKDGQKVEADIIVMNTGYTEDFDIIKDAKIPDVRNMYKHMIHPDLGADVAFIGWARPVQGGVPACSEMQARYFALLCSGKKQLPDAERLEKLITKQAAWEDEVCFGDPELRTLVDYTTYMSDFADVIGCSPWKLSPFRDPRLAYRLWSGSEMPVVYRLHGPHSNFEQAKKTIFNVPNAYPPVEVAAVTSMTFLFRVLGKLNLIKQDPEYSI